MADLPLARSDYDRSIAKEARLRLRNRYYEANPVLTDTQVGLISRPALRRWLTVGDGPIRGLYSQPGSFDDCLFVASYNQLWRVDKDETKTLIGSLPTNSLMTSVSMAATSNIGTTPAFLFVASGSSLMCYTDNGFANGSISGTPAADDTVTINDTVYKFTSGDVDTGTPAGTAAAPWLVNLGDDATDAWENFANAIDAAGVAGTDYSTDLDVNPDVQSTNNTATKVTVRANDAGTGGNSLATTETGAAIAWGDTTLTSGGDATWTQVQTPDDVGIISVGYCSSYVVCVPAQGNDINGRFYWIDPGETTIDPLDFATAERAPDPVYQVVVFGDQFWLPGSTTTEVWYFTGNADSPVARLQGITFDRGTWEGTALQVKESMIIVDSDGGVFQIAGGLNRISRPDIEQKIREAMQRQAAGPII